VGRGAARPWNLWFLYCVADVGKGKVMGDRVAMVALGGNALIADDRHQSITDQFERMRLTAAHIADMIEQGWDLVITHGNGPQVGFCLLSAELAGSVLGGGTAEPAVPLDVCVADTQGSLGYMIQQQLLSEFLHRGLIMDVVTVVTQVMVDPDDKAFHSPTKPVGPFYDEAQAREHALKDGWVVHEDAGRGWRRVVPSPRPLKVLEVEAIKALVARGVVVVGAGGGGIPVVADGDGWLRGVPAVVDKDYASSLLGIAVGADLLLIATTVEKVALNYRQPNQINLDTITIAEAERYLAEGHFHAGSMWPKVEACVQFVRATGHSALITSLGAIRPALAGETGTRIVP